MTVKPWLRTRNSGHRGAIGSAWERTSVLCRERLPLERLPRGGRLAEDVSRLALKFTMTGDESLATVQDVQEVRGGVLVGVGRNVTSEAELTVEAAPV